MRAVDWKMQSCPLKHEVRSVLWEKYARKAAGRRRKIRRYLTLYSPAMMDIKHFRRRGLIDFSDNQYKGVVAVTNDREAYQHAVTGGEGRPELVAHADINELLAHPSRFPRYKKRLREFFPFDVVNLDYTNSVFYREIQRDFSLHLAALSRLVDMQRRSVDGKFALLLTTLGQREEVAPHFLGDLADRVETNRETQETFRRRYSGLFEDVAARQLCEDRYDEFFPLGMVKLVADILSSNGFEILECETASIRRDRGSRSRWILHVATLAGVPQLNQIGGLRGLGRQQHLERRVARYLLHREAGRLLNLSESSDEEALRQRHGPYLQELVEERFELEVPEPIQE